MTSLFSRLQKLNKKGTKAPWEMYRYDSGEFGGMFNAPNAPHKNSIGAVSTQLCTDIVDMRTEDAELIVECRNSLPAMLDCIAALVRCCDETDYCYVCDNHPSHGHAKDCSLAVFVSGQEEPNG